VKRGGRKEMRMPDRVRPERTPDITLIKALARAYRWRQLLESGEFVTIAELAQREGIAVSYVTRVMRLTLLAPDLVEAILDGKQPKGITLPELMKPFQGAWRDQPAAPWEEK
jgi:ParB-like chromosome segregation protein Spo0J